MRTYIKKLQSKPEHIRKQILVGSLVVCMAFVFTVWIGSLGYKFGKGAEVAQNKETTMKPFALFGKTITDTYKNVTASVGNISSVTTKELPKVEVNTEKVVDLIPVENQ